jgi:hypothetical protein
MIIGVLKKLLCIVQGSIENFQSSYTEINHEKVYVRLEDCTSVNGFAFKDGWHFLVATLKQYENSSNIKYEDTFLARYYECYQPENLQQALFGKSSNIYIPQLLKYRDTQNAPMPWTPMFMLPNKYITHRSDYGPKDRFSRYGEQRFDKLVKIYESIKKDGFRKDENSQVSNHIKGILLKNNDNYKILVFNGNHRIAALSALGYQKIPFMFCRKYPVIVDIDNIDNWPCVRTGLYDKEVASKVFYITLKKMV